MWKKVQSHLVKEKIDFFIKRSKKRKTISIFVDPVEGVFLRVPLQPTIKFLSKLVHSKASWILDKQQWINEVMENLPKREFITGETFLYLGRQLRLRILQSKNKSNITVKGGRFLVKLNSDLETKTVVRNMLIHWYKQHAKIVLFKRSKIYTKKLKLIIPEIILANQSKRWGSCNHKGRIRLNWHIIMAPISLIDYVVVHELCHLKHANHSKGFWKILGTILPDYEIRRERLREKGSKYCF
ncbi:MAG: SprT family zinc-dependent metalloprotease [bacterium]